MAIHGLRLILSGKLANADAACKRYKHSGHYRELYTPTPPTLVGWPPPALLIAYTSIIQELLTLRWFDRLIPLLAKRQIDRDGPIILVQV